MTLPESVRVFVNGSAYSVPRGATVIDAVRTCNAEEARLALAGERAVTDSRGLPVGLDALVSGGAVLRVVSARQLKRDDTQAETA